MSKNKNLENNEVGYVIVAVVGLILGYLAGIGFPRIIISDAVYAAKYADHYQSQPGGPRAINLYYLFRNTMMGIGLIGGIAGVYIHKRTDKYAENKINIVMILKYAVIACLGGLILYIPLSIPVVLNANLPSAYNPYKLDAVHQLRVLRAQAMVFGVIVSLIGLLVFGYYKRLQMYKQNQRLRFEAIKEQYENVLDRMNITENIQSDVFEDYNPDKQESIQERDQALKSLNEVVEKYESLAQQANELLEVYNNTTYTNGLEHPQKLIDKVQEKIKNRDKTELSELNNDLQSRLQILSRAERRDKLLNEIQNKNYPDDIIEKTREDIFAVDISNKEEYMSRCDFIERFLDVSDNAKRIDNKSSDIKIRYIWDELRVSLEEKDKDSLNQIENLMDDIIKILTFCGQNNPEHSDIQNDILLDAVDQAIKENDPSLVDEYIEQIEKLNEPWTLEHLNKLSWRQFEYLVAQLWSDSGYNTVVTSGSGDEGIDVAAENSSERVAIQAKKHSPGNKVGNRVIRNTAGVLPRGFDRVIVVTSSSFTKPALEEANKYGRQVSLVNGELLLQELTESNISPENFT